MKTGWMSAWLVGIMIVVMSGCASTDDARTSPQPAETPTEKAVSPAPTPAAEDEPLANTLKWTTASEVDNFGFDIYRSLAEDGPFDRITAEPLPGAGTTDEPQKYVFADEDIDPSKDYYYYIESISMGGVREVFSPVIRAPAKKPAAEKE
jgi:hypothetical protein